MGTPTPCLDHPALIVPSVLRSQCMRVGSRLFLIFPALELSLGTRQIRPPATFPESSRFAG